MRTQYSQVVDASDHVILWLHQCVDTGGEVVSFGVNGQLDKLVVWNIKIYLSYNAHTDAIFIFLCSIWIYYMTFLKPALTNHIVHATQRQTDTFLPGIFVFHDLFHSFASHHQVELIEWCLDVTADQTQQFVWQRVEEWTWLKSSGLIMYHVRTGINNNSGSTFKLLHQLELLIFN